MFAITLDDVSALLFVMNCTAIGLLILIAIFLVLNLIPPVNVNSKRSHDVKSLSPRE